MAASSEIIAKLAQRVAQLEAENAKLKQGEWFYSADDPEISGGDWSEPLDYDGDPGPMPGRRPAVSRK